MANVETAHAALMDRVYRRQRHFYNATRRYYLLGRDRLIRDLTPPPNGRVLEIGCGTGRNLLKAARLHPNARFYGVDISSAMLESAGGAIERAQAKDRIVVAQGDATQLDPNASFGIKSFDRVYFSYTLSMIPPWRDALRHAASLVAPGGTLSVIDFGQQESLPRWFRALLFQWLGLFHVAPNERLHGELAKVARDYHAQFEFSPLYGGYAWYGRLRMPACVDRNR